MKAIRTFIVLVIVAIGSAIAYAYSGLYDVAVGTGHNPVTEWYLETLRERSIESRMAGIAVPGDLGDESRIEAGAGHYKEMCVACHGRPGKEPSSSFDPAPPALYRHAEEPAEAFWIAKNGIKMTAMPHHRDHSDRDIWDIVAFLQALPDMDAAAYEAMTAGAGHSHAEGGGHADEGAAASGGPAPDTPAQALDGFHNALMAGDREAALALLHQNATIVEGGHVETRQQYAAGHLDSDIEFLSQVSVEELSQVVNAGAEQASIDSTARYTGTFNGEPVDVRTSESASLVKTGAGWRIVHLNWSAVPADTEED